MRNVKMTARHHDSFDGDEVLTLEPGRTYEVPDDVAGRYFAAGIARPAELAVVADDVETKDDGSADENKDAGAADENKTEQPTPEVTVEDLLQLTRDQLDATAVEAGIENPDQLDSDQAVAEAIVAANAAASAEPADPPKAAEPKPTPKPAAKPKRKPAAKAEAKPKPAAKPRTRATAKS